MRRCCNAILVLSLATPLSWGQPAPPVGVITLEAAQHAYALGHWQEAFDAFAALADLGQPDAARIAALMWRFGPSLYHTRFSADAARVRRWTLSAAQPAP
jgi:hypothetical protein